MTTGYQTCTWRPRALNYRAHVVLLVLMLVSDAPCTCQAYPGSRHPRLLPGCEGERRPERQRRRSSTFSGPAQASLVSLRAAALELGPPLTLPGTFWPPRCRSNSCLPRDSSFPERGISGSPAKGRRQKRERAAHSPFLRALHLAPEALGGGLPSGTADEVSFSLLLLLPPFWPSPAGEICAPRLPRLPPTPSQSLLLLLSPPSHSPSGCCLSAASLALGDRRRTGDRRGRQAGGRGSFLPSP